MGNGLCLKISGDCVSRTQHSSTSRPNFLKIPNDTKPPPNPGLSFELKDKKPLLERPWVKGTLLVVNSASAVAGISLLASSKSGRVENALGFGLATFGIGSLGYELGDQIMAGKSMPRWAKITINLGAGILAGTLSYWGQFDTSGVGGSPIRNPVDKYGP